MKKYDVKCPSGFPEFAPSQERVRQQWLAVIREVFEKNGFLPIETPLVEHEENLVAKGGNPKEIYVLKRLQDEGEEGHSGNAIRFDHTVPLALYVARHLNELAFPFRRYVIGPVMRGERAQKGRFRQFDQCDIDVVGMENLSLLNDALMPAIIIQIFEKLKIGDFVVRINNRKILTGFFEHMGITAEKIKEVLAIVDDLEKVGAEKVLSNLLSAKIEKNAAQKILEFTKISGANEKIFEQLRKVSAGGRFAEGVRELREVVDALKAMGISENRCRIDLSIARGLDYYTGTVYETTLLDDRISGSICSGGRFDDLAEIFTGKKLPGVGISIGLTRLLSQLFEAGILKPDRSSPTQVLVIAADEKYLPQALELGTQIRAMGRATENYLEGKKLDKQFSYADKLGIPVCVVLGESEMKNGTVQVKNMKLKKQEEVKVGMLEKALKTIFK